MRICLHLQPASRSLGGAEVLALNIALLLQESHDVEIVHHREWLDTAQLAAFGGAQLTRVTTRYIARHPNYFASASAKPWATDREPKAWGRELAGSCDALLTLTHQLPPFNPTPHGALLLLFPMSSPLEEWPLVAAEGGIRQRLSRWIYSRQYDELWRGYDVKLAISHFTSRWAKRRWSIDCNVLWPLVDCVPLHAPKEDVVLTLGRFSVSGVSKHQREMAAAFSQASGLDGWRLVAVGEARTDDEQDYVRQLQEGKPTVLPVLNASREAVRLELARAKVYWHAAGLTESEESNPDRLEHFGIATVEAMASGCVPVVIGRGGQPEIVEHGQSGFLCQSLDEMVARTVELSGDPALMSRMSAAARLRAQAFGRTAFDSRLRELVPWLRA